MATQPTNIIDKRKLDDLRRELEGDRTPRLPDQVGDALQAVAEPIREVFVGVPELKTFIVGFVLGGLTVAVSITIGALLH